MPQGGEPYPILPEEVLVPDILSKRSGAVLEIILNRPEHGNGATDEMAIEVTRLIEEADDSTQAIVLRGAGSDFCIGRATMGQPPQGGPVEAQQRKRAFDVIFKTYGAIRNSPIPVIGVVQGTSGRASRMRRNTVSSPITIAPEVQP